MAGRTIRKSDSVGGAENDQGSWPSWARGLVSALLVFHLMAIVAAALGASPPYSELEQAWCGLFRPYYDLIDQGYAYRYYAEGAPPTEVVEATLHFADGRAEELVRIPNRSTRPRLRYQRQLALAHHLYQDFAEARAVAGDGSQSRLARSYARHLCKTTPGCVKVTLRARIHRIPEYERVRVSFATPGAPRVDPDADEFYDAAERIGEYSCDDL